MQHLQFLFSFFSNKGFHNNQKWKYWKVTNDINSNTYFTVQYSKYSNANIKHKIHYCKYRKTGQLCVGVITDPASVWVWPQDLLNVIRNIFSYWATGKITPCVPNSSMDWRYQCLRIPLPLPAEEACGHQVGGHTRSISKRKKQLFDRV